MEKRTVMAFFCLFAIVSASVRKSLCRDRADLPLLSTGGTKFSLSIRTVPLLLDFNPSMVFVFATEKQKNIRCDAKPLSNDFTSTV
jgi:hypothetical protein